MSTEIIIPREKTFKLKEGRYKAKIPNVTFKKAKRSDEMQCCLNFDVQVPGMERYECCARAVFQLDLESGSKLREFLEGLLGPKFFTDRSGQPLDLNKTLRDMDCEIELTHGPHDEDKYDWPMVIVKSAVPPKPVEAPKKEESTK